MPIGIWLNAIDDDTGYPAVPHRNISRLNDAIGGLTQFYTAEFCESLFRNAASSGE